MPNLKWSNLNHMQIGKYAEYFSKMEFTSYGLYIYTSEVDDHGVDFVVKSPQGAFYEVQVKSIRNTNYVFIPKDKIKLDERHLVCLIHFVNDKMPEMYVFPATVWKMPNAIFVDRLYDKPGQKSKPEWGINYSTKNVNLLNDYMSDKFLQELSAIKSP